MYDVIWLPNAAFVLMAGVVLLAALPSLCLPGRLMPADDKSAARVSLPPRVTEPFKPFGWTR